MPIHEAASSGRKELVLWFLEQRPNQINVPTNDGRTLLHIAASNENIEMCKVSIQICKTNMNLEYLLKLSYFSYLILNFLDAHRIRSRN